MIKIQVEVGQVAPEFTLKNQDQKDTSLSKLKGKNVIIAFYPFDFSPLCTDEMSCFQSELDTLKSDNTEILAISVDSHWSHKAFSDKLNLSYDLLSDFNKEVSKTYGVLREEGFSERAYFIVDKEGIVRFKKIMDNPGIKLENNELIDKLNKITG